MIKTEANLAPVDAPTLLHGVAQLGMNDMITDGIINALARVDPRDGGAADLLPLHA